MYKTTQDRRDYIHRVASHSTKPSPRGIIRDIPKDAISEADIEAERRLLAKLEAELRDRAKQGAGQLVKSYESLREDEDEVAQYIQQCRKDYFLARGTPDASRLYARWKKACKWHARVGRIKVSLDEKRDLLMERWTKSGGIACR